MLPKGMPSDRFVVRARRSGTAGFPDGGIVAHLFPDVFKVALKLLQLREDVLLMLGHQLQDIVDMRRELPLVCKEISVSLKKLLTSS